jgi:hypothetical protein
MKIFILDDKGTLVPVNGKGDLIELDNVTSRLTRIDGRGHLCNASSLLTVISGQQDQACKYRGSSDASGLRGFCVSDQ